VILCVSKNSEKSHTLEINDMVLSFVREPIITAIVPIKAYVDMIKSETFGEVNNIQKEKLQLIQKQINQLLILISQINVENLEKIKNQL